MLVNGLLFKKNFVSFNYIKNLKAYVNLKIVCFIELEVQIWDIIKNLPIYILTSAFNIYLYSWYTNILNL